MLAGSAKFAKTVAMSEKLSFMLLFRTILQGLVNTGNASAALVFISEEVFKVQIPSYHHHRRSVRNKPDTPSAFVLARVGLNLIQRGLLALLLIQLSNDVSMNPGPTSTVCSFCTKIIRKNQGFLTCASCNFEFHLKCIGGGYSEIKCCPLCAPSWFSTMAADVPESFSKAPNILLSTNGLRMSHWNVRSLNDEKFQEIRSLLERQPSSLDVLVITET